VTVLRSVVLGCGSYLPERVLSNEELAASVETSDEWIVQRTGIRQRHIAADGEVTSDLAIHAAKAALAAAHVDAQSIDLIVLGDLDARQHLSGGGGVGAGGTWHHPRRRLRPPGGVLGLRLWHRGHRRPVAHRDLQPRAGDRRRDILAHPRLERPHHLRVVRRRRRRGGDGGAAAARRQQRPWRAHHAPSFGWPAQIQALRRRRPSSTKTVGFLRMEGPRRCSSTPSR
jgi:hypothetical protein